MTQVAKPGGGSLDGPILLISTVFIGLLFAVGAAMSDDPLFQLQAYIFVAAAVIGGFSLNAAMSGATGRVTGPHLPWGLYWFEQKVDAQKHTGPMPAN
eukprot:gene4271-biopygen3530